jgi:hypothetical protein
MNSPVFGNSVSNRMIQYTRGGPRPETIPRVFKGFRAPVAERGGPLAMHGPSGYNGRPFDFSLRPFGANMDFKFKRREQWQKI